VPIFATHGEASRLTKRSRGQVDTAVASPPARPLRVSGVGAETAISSPEQHGLYVALTAGFLICYRID
jgi:hypothetical protein